MYNAMRNKNVVTNGIIKWCKKSGNSCKQLFAVPISYRVFAACKQKRSSIIIKIIV